MGVVVGLPDGWVVGMVVGLPEGEVVGEREGVSVGICMFKTRRTGKRSSKGILCQASIMGCMRLHVITIWTEEGTSLYWQGYGNGSRSGVRGLVRGWAAVWARLKGHA